jgi:hypothetical protein
MTSRIVQVGKGRRRTDQVITTQWLPGDTGEPHEHVTLETPALMTETQRLRLMTAREMGQTWKT